MSKTGETAATGAREYSIYTIQAGTVQDIVSQAQNMQTVQPYALVGQNVFLKIRACKSKLQISERNADRDRLIKFLGPRIFYFAEETNHIITKSTFEPMSL